MAEKSPKRLMLEASLADDPTDSFLRYGLAVQCLRDGDAAEGRARLRDLIADDPDNQVAAYQQLGQSHMDGGEPAEARAAFLQGIAKARALGDDHAAAEMDGFLGML